MRQALGAAVRWRYLVRNPAVDPGRNPQPRAEEPLPFTVDEVDALALELGPVYGPLVVVPTSTATRTTSSASSRLEQCAAGMLTQATDRPVELDSWDQGPLAHPHYPV